MRSTLLSTNASRGYRDRRKAETPDKALCDVVLPQNFAINEQNVSNIMPSSSMSKTLFGCVGEATNSSTSFKTGETRDPRRQELEMAIHRAVKLSRITHKDRRTTTSLEGKPFTFRKLLSVSRSGRRLVDIHCEVTRRTTGDDHLAREERKSWSAVPMFLVAIVHNNQASVAATLEEDEDIYKVLGYSPPTTEEQLEDVR